MFPWRRTKISMNSKLEPNIKKQEVKELFPKYFKNFMPMVSFGLEVYLWNLKQG